MIKLAEILKKQEKTGYWLGKKLKLKNPNQAYDWIKGKHTPQLKTLKKIAEALNITITDLI